MKYIRNISQVPTNKCYGCRACEKICPHKCINFITDEMGFIIPEINQAKCINCELCIKVCPYLQYNEPLNKTSAYAIKHKSSQIRYDSSSGGAFTAISDWILMSGGYVSGCIFNPINSKVEFIVSNSINDRDLMRGSKYVQADTKNVYIEIKDLLQQNKMVLFVGTPCQCEGLKKYLLKDYPNLFLVDILCHSVPSPLILSELINYYNKPIKQITMRDKINGWRGEANIKLITENGETIIDKTYLNLFYKGLISRPSCKYCQFTKTNRCTDITIGDYWKIDKVNPGFEDDLGVSLLLVNTAKGAYLFKNISDNLYYIKTSIKDSEQFCMLHPTNPSLQNKIFWRDFHRNGFAYCKNKYGRYSYLDKLLSGPIAFIIRKSGLSKFIRNLRKKY